MSDDPNDLLLRAKDGDSAALGEMLSSYHPYLLFLAGIQIGRRLQGRADAADLVQEACLEAHRHVARFRGQSQGEFAAWLRGILAGVVANHVRRHLGTRQRNTRLERSLVVELDQSSCILDGGLMAKSGSPSQHAVRRESATLIAGALARLPEDYRQVIVLRNFEDLAFADVAARMGRSVDSVQKLWVRALTQLRQDLALQSV